MTDELTLWRGLDKDGNTILFLDGEIGDGEIENLLTKWGGNPIGVPENGTSAIPIAKVHQYLGIESVLDGQEVTVGKVDQDDDDNDDNEPAPAPEPVNSEVVKINKGINERGVCFFAKSEIGDEGIAIGIVLEPTAADDGTPTNPDTQNDIYTKADVEKAAYVWLLNGGAVDLLHSWQELGKEEILGIGASDITHGECEFTKSNGKKQKVSAGTWLVTTVWNTNGTIWPQIKSGTLGAYSIGGTAVQETVE